MGYIKEPYGIDFIVDPKPLTIDDRKMISDVIAYYKATGRKKSFANTTKPRIKKKFLVRTANL
jgi:hypothetical protein